VLLAASSASEPDRKFPESWSPTILLENRDWLVKFTQSFGLFRCKVVENGEAAIRSWEEWNPGLILMDGICRS